MVQQTRDELHPATWILIQIMPIGDATICNSVALSPGGGTVV